jgi:hypothetical protein
LQRHTELRVRAGAVVRSETHALQERLDAAGTGLEDFQSAQGHVRHRGKRKPREGAAVRAQTEGDAALRQVETEAPPLSVPS